jgi:alkaline phosphatase D
MFRSLLIAVAIAGSLFSASSGLAAEGQNKRAPGSLLPAGPEVQPPDNPPIGGPESIPSDMQGRDWLRITDGVCAGDVTSHSAILWARSSYPGLMHVLYDTDPAFSQPRHEAYPASAIEAEDYTASLRLEGLRPATLYHYRIWFTGVEHVPPLESRKEEGEFRTAPDSTAPSPVTFVWGGDLGGDEYCRRVGKGYEICSKLAAAQPDFFLALGDMIYADGFCSTGGPGGEMVWENVPGPVPVTDPSVSWEDAARVRDIFWQHWRYNREDPHLRKLLASTSLYALWNDHEVLSDFGAGWDYWNEANRNRPGYQALVLEGRDAFMQYAPIDRDPMAVNRIYRSFRWGRDCELFLLDTRSYRSRNDLADIPANHKTMLGPDQLEWLRQGLLRSPATWKVVACCAPLSIPVGPAGVGRDGWASGTEPDSTGFERELLDLLSSLQAGRVTNLVFLTAGHWPEEIRYRSDPGDTGRPWLFHELVAGPLSAERQQPVPLDPTLDPEDLYREGGLFSFGLARIEKGADGATHFLAEIRGEDGNTRKGSRLDLSPGRVLEN